MIPWLTDELSFPAVSGALSTPNGLLAAGGDLSAARLLQAYRQGIFPWFSRDEPILWWSPDPRMVLIPEEFKISRSLSKVLRGGVFEIRCDTAFTEVMRACAAPRDGHQDTWIDEHMIAAYHALHRLGYAHSVEVWMAKECVQLHSKDRARRRRAHDADSAISAAGSERVSQQSLADGMELVGGLYGVCIGRMFYGESMFSQVSNASKVALAHLSKQLARWQFGTSTELSTGMIDCQMHTPHLASLGAHTMPRMEFIAKLQELVNYPPITHWQFDADLFT